MCDTSVVCILGLDLYLYLTKANRNKNTEFKVIVKDARSVIVIETYKGSSMSF